MQAPARCLGKFLVIKWFNEVTNVEVQTRTNLESIHKDLRKSRLHSIGHIRRMNDDTLLKNISYGEIQRVKMKVGRPLLLYSDSVK